MSFFPMRTPAYNLFNSARHFGGMLSIFFFSYKRQKATNFASIDLLFQICAHGVVVARPADQGAEGDGAADQSNRSLPSESIAHSGVALRTRVDECMNLVLDDTDELLLKKNVRKGDNISLIQQIQSTGTNA